MKLWLFSWLLGILYVPIYAQQTNNVINLTYQEAQSKLIKDNLTILAAYYNINLAEADVVQARLWNNPYLVWNQEAYSTAGGEVLKAKNQYFVQISQAFSIAGKYTNSVKLAKMNVELNKLIVQDILRSLLYELGERYFALSTLQQKVSFYGQIVEKYEDLIKSAENKLRVGAIALNEVTRLKSELIAVKTQSFQNQNYIRAEMSQLKILLNLSDDIYIQTQEKPTVIPSSLIMNDLIDNALASRQDFILAKKQIEYENQQFKVQRSLATPDLNLVGQYDKASNYAPNYWGVGIELSVPLFNRNQGNIQKAKILVNKATNYQQQVELQVRNEVQQSYNRLLNSQQGFEEFSQNFLDIIEGMNRNSINNYDKKNINLLEYIDLQRIYIQNRLQYIDIKNELQRSINQLNFAVGKVVIE